MSILISRESLLRFNSLKKGDPIPNLSVFKEALYAYNTRLLEFNNFSGVSLLNDPRVIYFKASTFIDIVKSGATHLVVRFGCEGEIEEYGKLSVIVCGMNKGEFDVITKHYIGRDRRSNEDDIAYDDMGANSVENWRLKENNYVIRVNKLLSTPSGRNEFLLDSRVFENGISHEIQELRDEWLDSAIDGGMTHIACYFIKVNNHLSVAFTDARLNLQIATLSYVVYDFGGGCCPPA